MTTLKALLENKEVLASFQNQLTPSTENEKFDIIIQKIFGTNSEPTALATLMLEYGIPFVTVIPHESKFLVVFALSGKSYCTNLGISNGPTTNDVTEVLPVLAAESNAENSGMDLKCFDDESATSFIQQGVYNADVDFTKPWVMNINGEDLVVVGSYVNQKLG